ncbi:hypothetical protein [Streptomyces collinus]|uniref:hypothetical protein n=1 Tax=Streptomyces collinus TaxID=42684 RepID=UPI00331D90A2
MDAAQLYKHAITHGSAVAAATLVDRLGQLHPADFRPALWAAAHSALDDPGAVAELLYALREVGAQEQVEVLAARAAADAALDDPDAVTRLLDALRKVRAQDQVEALAARLPAAGQFDQFIEISDHRERFRYGREPNGSAGPPWTWDDLA